MEASSPGRSGVDEPRDPVLDVLYGVLFQPRATFRRLRDRPPLGLGVIVFAAASLVAATVSRRLAPAILEDMDGFPFFGIQDVDLSGLVGATTAAGLWMGTLVWLLTVAVWHLLAGLLGGTGSGRSLLAFTGLAQLPQVFTAPLAVLQLNMGVPALTGFGFALDIWRLYLHYRALRAVYGLSRGRTLLVMASPLLFLFLAGLVAVLLLAPLVPGPLSSPVPADLFRTFHASA